MICIATDIGGTFTDVVVDKDGALTTTKVLTTPEAPERGLLDGIEATMRAAGVTPKEVHQVIHGATLATNALIERRGAVTIQIVTEGFRDVLEMAHENRFDQYDIGMDRAPPLMPRALRWEVSERVAADGRVLKPLDEAGVRALAERLEAEGAQSVAVTLMHAYANPAHEQCIRALIAERLPDLMVSLSCEVSPEIREYERFATTCANAYVRPLMAGYLTALSRALEGRGFRCPLHLVTSSGDLTDLDTATAFPVRLVESGPAGGAVLAAHIAKSAGLEQVLAFDMGGTTAKLCLIDHGRPQTTRSFEVGRVHQNMKGSGFPVRIPAIDLVEIGSGGGSIARVDALGRLLVGPHSAGAAPGPVCYGRGGQAATVTDGDVALGRIDIGSFSGGVRLDVEAARGAIARDIGAPLALAADTAAFAICEIVDENMASAARVHAIESGKDLSGRTLIAFGGAAPLHAARVAEKLGVSEVLVPANAGVGSAIGFLAAGLAFEQVRSLFMSLDDLDGERVDAALAEMSGAARALLGGDGAFRETRSAYMRYRGQGHEVLTPLPDGPMAGAAGALEAAFAARYAELFGRTIPNVPVEVLTWSVRVERVDPAPLRDPQPPLANRADPRPDGSAQAWDAGSGRRLPYAVLRRDDLPAGYRRRGPCLVIEAQTTTVVPAAFDLEVVKDGALRLTRWEGRAA